VEARCASWAVTVGPWPKLRQFEQISLVANLALLSPMQGRITSGPNEGAFVHIVFWPKAKTVTFGAVAKVTYPAQAVVKLGAHTLIVLPKTSVVLVP